jgi:hypothetical protein
MALTLIRGAQGNLSMGSKTTPVFIAVIAGAFATAMGRAPTPTPSTPPPTLNSDGHHYRAIVFGGSCEEGSSINDFHDSFIQISAGLTSTGWDVRPLFAGDSSHCAGTAANPCPEGVDVTQWSVAPIAAAAKKDPSTVGRASKASLLASLDQASTDLAKGDELLLVINTHGYGEQVKGQAYWDHGICISSDQPGGTVANLDPATGKVNSPNKEGLMYMSDPDLQARLKKLSSAGIKMGFLDDSCYGGGSVPEFSQYGCTMSSTTSQQLNSETGDTSTNEDGSEESQNGIAFNLPDLLQVDSDTLASQALNSHEVTMEELWLRVLARSKIAGLPEYSGYLKESAQAEALGNWMYALEGDVSFRRGDTPFTPNPGKNIETATPLVSYAQTYLATLPAALLQTQAAQLVASYWISPGLPGTDDAVDSKTPSALQTAISQLPTDWSSWVSQFNALTAQEAAILHDLESTNIFITWTFNGELAGTSSLLNEVMPTISQQGVFTYQTSQKGNLWIEVGDSFVTPDDSNFAAETQIASNTIEYFMNAYKLQHDNYLSGLDDSFADSLSQMMIESETQAWKAASLAEQTQMKVDFQKLKDLRTQETALLSETVVDTRAYLAQARMYSFLDYRQQAALVDPKISQCAEFVLKRY